MFFETISLLKEEICNLRDQWISSDNYISFTKSDYHAYGSSIAAITGIIIVSAPLWRRAIDGKLTGKDLS